MSRIQFRTKVQQGQSPSPTEQYQHRIPKNEINKILPGEKCRKNFIENLKFVKILIEVFGKPLKNVRNSSANFNKNLKINFTNYQKQLRNLSISEVILNFE